MTSLPFAQIFLIFDKFSSLSNSVKSYKRDYWHFNPQHLLSEFQLIDWHSVFLDQDASNIFSTFYNKISVIIDISIFLLSNFLQKNAGFFQNLGLLQGS